MKGVASGGAPTKHREDPGRLKMGMWGKRLRVEGAAEQMAGGAGGGGKLRVC